MLIKMKLQNLLLVAHVTVIGIDKVWEIVICRFVKIKDVINLGITAKS